MGIIIQLENQQKQVVTDASPKTDELGQLEDDFANLARLSIQESYDDVRLILAKLVRKYRGRRPVFAERINQTLKAVHMEGSAENLPVVSFTVGPEFGWLLIH